MLEGGLHLMHREGERVGREWGVGRRVRGESGGGGRVIKRRPVSTNSFSGKGPH